jgi:hypothetical protein
MDLLSTHRTTSIDPGNSNNYSISLMYVPAYAHATDSSHDARNAIYDFNIDILEMWAGVEEAGE